MEKKQLKTFVFKLKKMYPNLVQLDFPLAAFTTYNVGGPARVWVRPDERSTLQYILKLCHLDNIPIFVLGSGSNVLINDRGLDRVVINLQDCCNQISHKDKIVYAGAGALVEELVQYCENNGLAGLDYMSGIPGTIGGALRMNAGAFVGEIGDRVSKLEAFSLDGTPLELSGAEAGFGYRQANRLQNIVLLGCWLNLFSGSQPELERARKNYLKKRANRQPLDYGSCGSVFKRPPGFYAGELVEKAGCKGRQIGGAMVSEKHANFIINKKYTSKSVPIRYRILVSPLRVGVLTS